MPHDALARICSYCANLVAIPVARWSAVPTSWKRTSAPRTAWRNRCPLVEMCPARHTICAFSSTMLRAALFSHVDTNSSTLWLISAIKHSTFVAWGLARVASTSSDSSVEVVTVAGRFHFHVTTFRSTEHALPLWDAQFVGAELASANTCIGPVICGVILRTYISPITRADLR